MPPATRVLLTRRSISRLLRLSPWALALLTGAASSAAAQVPAEYTGDWVPVAATCASPARVRVEAARITLVNGADSQSFAGVEMAGPAFFGPEYRGVMAQAITEFDGDQPVQVTFNVGEKEGRGAGRAVLARRGQCQRLRQGAERAPCEAEPGQTLPAPPGTTEEVPGRAMTRDAARWHRHPSRVHILPIPTSLATAASRASAVQSDERHTSADARRCASTQPMPRPWSSRCWMNSTTSACGTNGA